MKYNILYLFVIICISISIFVLQKNVEPFSSSNKIPKVIISTYPDKSKIPKKVCDNVRTYAPEYEHVIFDDDDVYQFLEKNYPKNVVDTFMRLEGAHKADLFRYCYLYKYGGVYVDIKTEFIESIHSIFNKKDVQLYTVLSIHKGTIYQGIIASEPNNPLFMKLIDFMTNIQTPVTDYLLFTKDFYTKLQDYYTDVRIGYNEDSRHGKYNLYILNEECTRNAINKCTDGLDRYGSCCFINDEDIPVVKTRYSDYPWK